MVMNWAPACFQTTIPSYSSLIITSRSTIYIIKLQTIIINQEIHQFMHKN